MKREPSVSGLATLWLALCIASAPAHAQTPRAQAEKELARKTPAATVPACSLITRADVKKATGRDPLVEPEPSGQGGWICNLGAGELKVYSGAGSSDAWEATLKGFKKDKEPRMAASAFGERAYFVYPKPDNKDQGNVGLLVVSTAGHTLALSLEAPDGKPAESTRPALESLMRQILTRLPQ